MSIPAYFAPYRPREYRGFTITHESDGWYRAYRGMDQVGWARRLKDCKSLVDQIVERSSQQ